MNFIHINKSKYWHTSRGQTPKLDRSMSLSFLISTALAWINVISFINPTPTILVVKGSPQPTALLDSLVLIQNQFQLCLLQCKGS